MSDRFASSIFGQIFKKLGSDPTPQHKKWAAELWKMSREYDFSDCQMECDKALVKLDLARKGIDPEFPRDGRVMLYGPLKKSK